MLDVVSRQKRHLSYSRLHSLLLSSYTRIPLGRTGDAALLGLGIIAFSLVALFGWPSLRVPHEGAAVDRMGNPIYPRKILGYRQ